MNKQRTDKGFFQLVMFCMCIAVSIGLVLWLSSCSPTKRASKLYDKAARLSEKTVAEKCAAKFPNKDSINERTVYVQGEEIILHDTVTTGEVMLINDTLYRTRYITKTITKTDTLYKDKITTVTNTAAIKALELQHIDDVKTISAKSDRLTICYWTLGILGIYTLGRWILRIWNIKLP